MFKKLFVIVNLIAVLAPLHAATNARIHSLGYAYFVGDILVSVPQGWQILLYPDQIQGDAAIAEKRPGPVVMTKSIGENFAFGASVNTFDRRTKGSTMFSQYYQRSILFADKQDPFNQTVPNFPQLNFAFKIGEQKFGINIFGETKKFDEKRVTPSNDTDYISSEETCRTSVVGGCITARIGGNFGWNPWFRVGVPILESEDVSKQVTGGTVVVDTVKVNNTDRRSRNLMFNFGSCFDYTFGDFAWAIIGAWYRSEQYKFVRINSNSPDTPTYSPRWDHNYLEYFAAITPKVFGNLMLGLEYQGAYFWDKIEYQDGLKQDTTNQRWYNSVLIAMELPIKVKKLRILDTFTPRGCLRYNIGKGMRKTEIENVSNPGVVDVTEEWFPVSTKNDVLQEGMILYLGFGLTKRRVTIDVSTNVLDWFNLGMVTLPPATHLTLTCNLHGLRQ